MTVNNLVTVNYNASPIHLDFNKIAEYDIPQNFSFFEMGSPHGSPHITSLLYCKFAHFPLKKEVSTLSNTMNKLEIAKKGENKAKIVAFLKAALYVAYSILSDQ